MPTTIGERYRVVRLLARGGMGVVYEVQHATTGRAHAAKLIQSGQLEPATLLERFHREARSAARIESRHVVDISDAGLADELGGTPFIIMERLVGCDLAELVAQRGHLSAGEVVALLAQAASALEAAHGLPLLHRDLKPANLFLHREPNGEVLLKILDFGLATSVRDLLGDHTVTGSGDIMGTPAYMAPEQAQGRRELFGPGTDLWAMGMVAFELLSGEPYFAGQTTGQTIARLVGGAPLDPPSQLLPGFSPAFDQWFGKSCHVDPSQRFVSALEQARALAQALGVAVPALGERLPMDLVPEVAATAAGGGPTADQVARHVLGNASTLRGAAHTPAPSESGRRTVWAMAAITVAALAVATVALVARSWEATEPASGQASDRAGNDEDDRELDEEEDRPPTGPLDEPVDYVRSPEQLVAAIDELGDDVVLQQVFTAGPTATIEARTASHPEVFFWYVVTPTGLQKRMPATRQRPAEQHFSPAVVKPAIIRSVLAEAATRMAGREVVETNFVILYEESFHRQVVMRVLMTLSNRDTAFVHFDVRGKRLGEHRDGRYHYADE